MVPPVRCTRNANGSPGTMESMFVNVIEVVVKIPAVPLVVVVAVPAVSNESSVLIGVHPFNGNTPDNVAGNRGCTHPIQPDNHARGQDRAQRHDIKE